MATNCDVPLEEIKEEECLTDSLIKLNNNFENLQTLVCSLKNRLDARRMVRTFFYYGPNASVDPTSGMQDEQATRPSDMTIESFVNSPTQLNLPAISFENDIAYVIYQKSGYFNTGIGNEPEPGIDLDSVTNYTIGQPINLKYNVWYPTFAYADVIASISGNRKKKKYGTINLYFRLPPTTQAKNNKLKPEDLPRAGVQAFSYTASGNPKIDTVIRWNNNNVIYAEEDPSPQIVVNTLPKPYKNNIDAQFAFTHSGGTAPKLRARPKIRTTLSVAPESLTRSTIDVQTFWSPVFIIWRLTYKGNRYVTDLGFPQFTRAETADGNLTPNWNRPQTWTTYDSWNTF